MAARLCVGAACALAFLLYGREAHASECSGGNCPAANFTAFLVEQFSAVESVTTFRRRWQRLLEAERRRNAPSTVSVVKKVTSGQT